MIRLLIATLLTFSSLGYADDFEEKLLLQLITAKPGDIIEMPSGTYSISTQLSLTVDQVTLRGQGMSQTILNFASQSEGAEGLIVTGNKIKLEGFTIQDTKGDAIKINRAKDVTIRHVKAEWTKGAATTNGAYGLYPVQSENILIEGCVVSGASDAGIYVGQSKNVIIRRNEAFHNVAGIEVENSQQVDVYHNYTHDNTGGILVFNMPDLSIAGAKTRVFGNTIANNNTTNFAPPSNTVADVPAGTGLMITANKEVEVFENFLTGNKSAGMLLVSYLITQRPINDRNYDPYVEGIYIYDNTFLNSGFSPVGGSSPTTQEMIELLKQIIGSPFPDIIYDGSVNPKNIKENGEIVDYAKICITNNFKVRYLNLDFSNELANMSNDLNPHQCNHSKLPPVALNEID